MKNNLHVLQTGEEKDNSRSKNKKRVIILICVLSVLGIASSVMLQNFDRFTRIVTGKNVDEDQKENNESKFYFYPVDFTRDVTKDDVYMSLDRDIYFKQGGETICLADEDPNTFTEDLRFFYRYFDSIIEGDAETYNSFFTEYYYETNKPLLPFAPQMIYDIMIEKLGQIDNDNGDIFYTYDVIYKIYQNDGSFRRDMDSDSSRRLCFYLVQKNGVVKIDSINGYIYG